MKADDLTASWDEEAKILDLKVGYAHRQLGFRDYCDTEYVKKGDTLVVRLSSMTRYHLDGWEKGQDHENYRAIKAWVDYCRGRLLDSVKS